MTKSINSGSGEKGFTLVELSIVMIIIGLLIGGVLKGQELIANARVAASVSKLKAIDAAINTFRDSYQGLPGDLSDPVNRLPNCIEKCAAAAAATTLGNSQIGAIQPGVAQPNASENIVAWAQLAATDMLGGVGNLATGANIIGGSTVPNAEVPGQIYIAYSTGAALTAATSTTAPRAGHYLLIHNGVNTAAGLGTSLVASSTTATIPSGAASRIDAKLDDGRPNTGSTLAMGLIAAGTDCATANDTTGVYRPNGTCGIYERIQQ